VSYDLSSHHVVLMFIFLPLFVADRKSEIAFTCAAVMLRAPPKRGRTMPQPSPAACTDELHVDFEAVWSVLVQYLGTLKVLKNIYR